MDMKQFLTAFLYTVFFHLQLLRSDTSALVWGQFRGPWGLRSGISSEACEVWGLKSEVWGLKSEVWGLRSEAWSKFRSSLMSEAWGLRSIQRPLEFWGWGRFRTPEVCGLKSEIWGQFRGPLRSEIHTPVRSKFWGLRTVVSTGPPWSPGQS